MQAKRLIHLLDTIANDGVLFCLIGVVILVLVGLAARKSPAASARRMWLGSFGLVSVGLGASDFVRGLAAGRLPSLTVTAALCATDASLILLVQQRRRSASDEGRAFYREVVDGHRDPIAVLDAEARCTGTNAAADRLGARGGKGILGWKLLDILPQSARPDADKAVEQVLGGARSRFEVELAGPDGRRLVWQVMLHPVPGQDDGGSCFVADFADITAARNEAEELRRRLTEQAMLLDDIETQIWYLTDPETYGALNRAHAEYLNSDKASVERRNIYDFASQKTAPVCVEGNSAAFESKKQYRAEIRVDDPDGRPRFLSVIKTPRLNDKGQVESLICTAQDVTEHKRAEAGLRMQTSAINAASDQVVIADLRGRIEFANPAFENETGYSFDEVVGKNPRFLKSGKQDVAFYALLWNMIRNGKTWRGEVVNKRKDGTEYVVQMTIAPVKNEEGVTERFVAISRNITEKKLFEQRMDYLAHHDSLTGLPNRLLIGHRLTQRLNQAKRQKKKVAVLFLDLDGFKLVNDTMGHNSGDLLLKTAAERLKACCRDDDALARMGGDEFLVVIPEIKRPEDARRLARRILKALSKAFVLDGKEVFVTASIGISICPSHGDDVEALVKNADAAMYRAKEQGRDGFYIYDKALNVAASERMALVSSLRKALERDEFVVYYQPRVEVATGRILGAEALVRWRHPELGLVYPGQFIPVAEETGLVAPIGDRVLSVACAQNKAWQDAGLPRIEVSVNLSARQFQRTDSAAVVSSALEQSGLDPGCLELEITESALMQSPEQAAAALNKMKEMGAHISIDDFGTGYSSLSYLKRFPVDALKVDRSFIKDITTDPDDAAITRAVIAMAHSLNLSVVAEGVETLEQLEFLFELGCDHMQGYFVSPAVPPEEFEHLLRDSESAPQYCIKLAA